MWIFWCLLVIFLSQLSNPITKARPSKSKNFNYYFYPSFILLSFRVIIYRPFVVYLWDQIIIALNPGWAQKNVDSSFGWRIILFPFFFLSGKSINEPIKVVSKTRLIDRIMTRPLLSLETFPFHLWRHTQKNNYSFDLFSRLDKREYGNRLNTHTQIHLSLFGLSYLVVTFAVFSIIIFCLCSEILLLF